MRRNYENISPEEFIKLGFDAQQEYVSEYGILLYAKRLDQINCISLYKIPGFYVKLMELNDVVPVIRKYILLKKSRKTTTHKIDTADNPIRLFINQYVRLCQSYNLNENTGTEPVICNKIICPDWFDFTGKSLDEDDEIYVMVCNTLFFSYDETSIDPQKGW